MKRKEFHILVTLLLIFDAFWALSMVNTNHQQAKRIERLEVRSTAQQRAIELLKANITKLYADKNNVGG